MSLGALELCESLSLSLSLYFPFFTDGGEKMKFLMIDDLIVHIDEFALNFLFFE